MEPGRELEELPYLTSDVVSGPHNIATDLYVFVHAVQDFQ
jgi:hypothetical protein